MNCISVFLSKIREWLCKILGCEGCSHRQELKIMGNYNESKQTQIIVNGDNRDINNITYNTYISENKNLKGELLLESKEEVSSNHFVNKDFWKDKVKNR